MADQPAWTVQTVRMTTRDASPQSPSAATPRVDSIDLGYLGLPGAANSFLLRSRHGPVLVESGPQVCLDTLDAGLRDRGIDPAGIAHCFVTHIHLDHAGAAGALAQRGTMVHVHPLGAPHLVDPSRLIAGSRRVHGSAYERWYGDPLAAPADRVHAAGHGERIDLGDMTFDAVETPGHAKHHHAWLMRSVDAGSILFTGDAAATLVPGSRFVGIPTPPPEYSLHSWLESLDRMREAGADRLMLTHGGAVDTPQTHLALVRSRLLEEDAWLRAAISSSADDDAVLERYQPWLHALADQAAVPARSKQLFIGEWWMRMNIMGVRRAMATGGTAPAQP